MSKIFRGKFTVIAIKENRDEENLIFRKKGRGSVIYLNLSVKFLPYFANIFAYRLSLIISLNSKYNSCYCLYLILNPKILLIVLCFSYVFICLIYIPGHQRPTAANNTASHHNTEV